MCNALAQHLLRVYGFKWISCHGRFKIHLIDLCQHHIQVRLHSSTFDVIKLIVYTLIMAWTIVITCLVELDHSRVAQKMLIQRSSLLLESPDSASLTKHKVIMFIAEREILGAWSYFGHKRFR